jgi:hypothetical protein
VPVVAGRLPTLLTDSIAACARAADDEPPLMTAALLTVSMNSCSSQSGSPITAGAGLPA